MITAYCSINDQLVETDTYTQKGGWIDLVNPASEEVKALEQATGVYNDFLRYPLDDEERPRIETENAQIMVIIHIPTVHPKTVMYDTVPLGIIITDDHIVTICLEKAEVLNDFSLGKIKGMATFKRTRFLLQILYKNASLYLKYLRQIEKKMNEIELELHKSMKNQELITLLNLQKGLVYFTTSLKSNEKVLEKLLRGKSIKMYEEDEELLEDVIVEIKQAVDMAETYSNISSSMMDAFASIISNNLNMVMKFLAAITIILALPTMVASFFGMNVALPFQQSPFGFAVVVGISVLFSAVATMYLAKRDMF
ncbi:MAG TPA: magnesium transporter CorA family protein [Desulfobacteria bacterium]|nr:magnesium transporter CorA family protein [Desulfobacteria bacterium]